MSSPTYKSLLDRFERVRADRMPRLREFWEGRRGYLVVQGEPTDLYVKCRTAEEAFQANVRRLEAFVDIPSDHVAYVEPWHGTGIYAHSFGSPYRWFLDEAPATEYAFRDLDEAMAFRPLRPADNEVMQLVLETIGLFKARFGDAVPIALTDTQSAFDTATLVVDSCNLLLACCDRPREAMAYLRRINSCIVEFSRMQAERCGGALTKPGHIMPSTPEWRGISISDDNIMFCSPDMNRCVTAPINEELGRAFGGIAVHSCGKWAHSMPVVRDMACCVMVDCSVGPAEQQDCNPPEQVKEVFRGSDVILHARLWGDDAAVVDLASRLADPEIRLAASVWCRPEAEQREEVYARLDAALASVYH